MTSSTSIAVALAILLCAAILLIAIGPWRPEGSRDVSVTATSSSPPPSAGMPASDGAGTVRARSIGLRDAAREHRTAPEENDDATAGADERDLATLRGRLVGAAGEPIAGVAVHLSGGGGDSSRRIPSDVDGQFVFEELDPRSIYRLAVTPPADAPWRERQLVGLQVPLPGRSLEVELEEVAAASLEGWLIDSRGRPLTGLSMRVRRADSERESVSLETGVDGRFRVDTVPAGRLVVESVAAPHVAVHGLTLTPDEHRLLEVQVPLGRVAVGGSVSRGGSPVRGARVVLQTSLARGKLRTTVRIAATTDARGRFAAQGLGDAIWTARVQLPGFDVAPREFAVREGEPAPTVDFDIGTR